MSGILILEDSLERIRLFKQGLIGAAPVLYVHRAKDAIKALSEGSWDFVFLDHDLGEHSKVGDGTMVCAWVAEHAHKFKGVSFIIHSLNGPARERMTDILLNVELFATEVPFAWTNNKMLESVVAHMQKVTKGSI